MCRHPFLILSHHHANPFHRLANTACSRPFSRSRRVIAALYLKLEQDVNIGADVLLVTMAAANPLFDLSDDGDIAAGACRDTRSPSPGSKAVHELLASVLSDWTCIAAGVPSPLSANSVEHLQAGLDKPIEVSELDAAAQPAPSAAGPSQPPSKRRRRADTAGGQGLPVGQYAGGTAGGSRPEPRSRRRLLQCPLPGLQIPFAFRELPHVSPQDLASWNDQFAEATAWLESKLDNPRRALGLNAPLYTAVMNMAMMELRLMKPPAIPLSHEEGSDSASVVFLTQLFPKHYSAIKRSRILSLFAAKAAYVPRCVVHSPKRPALFFYGAEREELDFEIQEWTETEGTRRNQAPVLTVSPLVLGPGAWPSGRLPSEICEAIAEHLHRDDIKSLRLVCKELEEKFSILFRSVVVPFSSELYSFAAANGRPTEPDTTSAQSLAVGKSDMKMFQERGWNIRRFAIAFDFNEDTLATPLSIVAKPKWSRSQCFYGEVDWPEVTNTMRYDRMRDLEATAAQTQKMKAAFGLLTNLRGLGLYLDNGFGWLNGPDQSDGARKARRPHPVFQPIFLPNEVIHTKRSPTLITGQEQITISSTEMLRQYARVLQSLECYESRHLQIVAEYLRRTPVNELPELNREEIKKHVNHFLVSKDIRPPAESHWMTLPELVERRKADNGARRHLNPSTSTIPTAPKLSEAAQKFADDLLTVKNDESTNDSHGRDIVRAKPVFDSFDLTVDEDDYLAFKGFYLSRLKHSLLRPGDLTQLQLRLLKENEWAEHAFLNTFMLSVIDNPRNMASIRILNIAQLPSSQLGLLDRPDFWDGLPLVGDLTLLVSPDWREVPFAPSYALDNHEELSVLPSLASERLGRFLAHRIAGKDSIRGLHVGYVGGGEHATGLFARNRHILPAPILPAHKNFPDVLLLPHVARLTLVNCWMPGAALLRFAERMGRHSLENLRFESFSLLPFDGLTTLMDVDAAPQLRNAESMWINGKRYIDYLVPYLTAHATAAFHNVNGESLAVRVTKPMGPDEYLKQGPMPGTWGLLLHRLMPRSVPALGASPRRAPGPKSPDVGGPASPETIPLGLKTIELASCGYAKLRNQALCPQFDVRENDASHAHAGLKGRMQERLQALRPLMMAAPDVFLAQVVPRYIVAERALLTVVYDLETGWTDEAAAVQCCEDDQDEGGTGRYSGTIEAL